MKHDFDALVAAARDGKPGPLLHALRRIKVLSKPYPECVKHLFAEFATVAQPNGRPINHCPPIDKKRIFRAYKAWWSYSLKYTYSEKRTMARIAKKTGAKELRNGRWEPIVGTPSEIASGEIEEETGITRDTYLDLVYGDRHKNNHTMK